MKIDKTTAANHQLTTAIELFFADGDPISIRTLLGSAWNILHDLLSKTNLESSRDWITQSFPQHSPNQIIGILKDDWNFFKHADRDPDALLEFDDSVNEALLMFAVNDFAQLTKATTFPMEIYQFWFIAKNEKIFKDVKQENLFEFSKFVFPNIVRADLSQQKNLARQALKDPKLYRQHIDGRYLLTNKKTDK